MLTHLVVISTIHRPRQFPFGSNKRRFRLVGGLVDLAKLGQCGRNIRSLQPINDRRNPADVVADDCPAIAVEDRDTVLAEITVLTGRTGAQRRQAIAILDEGDLVGFGGGTFDLER